MRRALGAAASAAVLAISLTGCGNDDLTAAQAKTKLESELSGLSSALTKGATVATAWQAAPLVQQKGGSCDADEARWRALATWTTQESTSDRDNPVATAIAHLQDAGWDSDTFVGDLDTDAAAVVPAHKRISDDTFDLTVTISEAEAGWHYVVLADTGCHDS